jgi:cytochrome P450
LIPGAIEEMLRLDPPFHLDFRKALADVEIGGQQISRGQMVFQVLAAANRDPRRYADPDTFELGRNAAPHLAFSHGVHFCVGAPLARLEGEVALRRILERFPGFVAGEAPALRRTDNILARGWHRRPVRL